MVFNITILMMLIVALVNLDVRGRLPRLQLEDQQLRLNLGISALLGTSNGSTSSSEVKLHFEIWGVLG
jgi:hypothetical protein